MIMFSSGSSGFPWPVGPLSDPAAYEALGSVETGAAAAETTEAALREIRSVGEDQRKLKGDGFKPSASAVGFQHGPQPVPQRGRQRGLFHSDPWAEWLSRTGSLDASPTGPPPRPWWHVGEASTDVQRAERLQAHLV